MTRFNQMVKNSLLLKSYYPKLDFRPVKNYFCEGDYTIVWFFDYPNEHIAVLNPNFCVMPKRQNNFFVDLKAFIDLFEMQCSDDFYKHLMRHTVQHYAQKTNCGENCDCHPLCCLVYHQEWLWIALDLRNYYFFNTVVYL